jgi:CSLREA domain-containing protein
VNSKGVGYSPVLTFQTLSLPGSGSLVVTTTADEDNGNSEPNNGTGTSLREAVNYANAPGGMRTITFSPNLFIGGPATLTLTGQVFVANLTGTNIINGPGARQLTIDGNGSRIFQMNDGAMELNGITFTRGGGNEGGAIRSHATLIVNDCVFTNNTTMSRGGAIYNGGAGRISRTTFVNNRAGAPGFSGGPSGGAIANEGVLHAFNSTFYGNIAEGDGSVGGGALVNIYGASSIRLTCSTVASNCTSGSGGGIKSLAGSLTLNNTIVSGNTASTNANVAGTLTGFSSFNLLDANTADIFATGLLADNGGPTPTLALKSNGLAVDAGTNALAADASLVPLPTDQRGLPRIDHGRVDIGAVEFQFPPPTITSANAVTFTAGQSNRFSVSATSYLPTVISVAGTLPHGISFSAGAFSGAPPFGTEGTYPVTITASNGVLPNATQSFTFTVAPASVPSTALADWRAMQSLVAAVRRISRTLRAMAWRTSRSTPSTSHPASATCSCTIVSCCRRMVRPVCPRSPSIRRVSSCSTSCAARHQPIPVLVTS